MNPERIIELVTDAVTAALRERLPDLISAHAKAVLEPFTERVIKAEAALTLLDGRAAPLDALEGLRAALLSLDQEVRQRVPEQIRAEISTAAADLTKRLGALDMALADASAKAAPAEAIAPLHDAVAGITERLDTFISEQEATNAEQISAEVSAKVAALTLPVGPAGAPGAPGRDGRDATFISPVHFKAGASFSRGSIVQHRGGLWFANVDTSAEPGDPLSGFSLIVDGCEPDRCEADPSGALGFVFRFASGVEKCVPLGFRPIAYAGVFDHARAYVANELVTSDGSMWIARRDAQGTRPGTEAGALVWTLVVKRGKDGRDGERGASGPQGEQGPPGAPPAKRKATNGAAA